MRVLYVVDRVDKYGSIESFKQMVDSLVENCNIEPIIIIHKKGRVSKWAIEKGYEYHIVNYMSLMIPQVTNNAIINNIIRITYKVWHDICLFFSINKCLKIINSRHIDIIHTNINRVDLGIHLAKKINIPHVWHIREFGDNNDYPLKPINSGYIDLINNSNLIIFISHAIEMGWINKGINPLVTKVLWDGIVNDNHVINRKSEILSNNIVRIVISGNITKNKGQDQIIKAIYLLPSEVRERITLDVYGGYDNNYYKQLKTFINTNNMDNVTFKGFVENVEELYSDYDIGVMCSRCEGLGRVTIDYMSQGCLVMASRSGANIELIDDGVNAFLYDYNNAKELSSLLLNVINNPEHSRAVAKNGYEFAISKFNSKKYSENIYKLYHEVSN